MPASAIEALLSLAYVGGGFTDAATAASMFEPARVCARGQLFVVPGSAADLLGLVVAVRGGTAACRFARVGEAELHLLAVHPAARNRGLGEALVQTAMNAAREDGASRMLLWTQPPMAAARRLYERLGFVRRPELDFSRGDRPFLVLSRTL